MLGSEIAAYLAGAGLGLTVSTNLFAVPFPDWAPDAAVALEVTGGEPSARTFGPSLAAPLGETMHFAVIVRGGRDGTAAAEQLAPDIYKKLDFLGPVVLSGVLYRDVRSTEGAPKFLAFDQNNRPLFYCTYVADKDRS